MHAIPGMQNEGLKPLRKLAEEQAGKVTAMFSSNGTLVGTDIEQCFNG